MANLICDELRYLLHIPGGRLRRDSSLYKHIRTNFVHQKNRVSTHWPAAGHAGRGPGHA